MIVCCLKKSCPFGTISFFVLIVQAMARFGEMAYAEFSEQLVGRDP
jgi:hypothetical protein